jgi:hypothetical protein
MINALSIDLEYWWWSEFLTKYLPEEKRVPLWQTILIVF